MAGLMMYAGGRTGRNIFIFTIENNCGHNQPDCSRKFPQLLEQIQNPTLVVQDVSNARVRAYAVRLFLILSTRTISPRMST